MARSKLIAHPTFPSDARDALQADARRNALRALDLHRELRAVLDALRSAGVAAMPLKGTGLSSRLYGDLSARNSGDIDLLVAPHDWAATDEQVRARGYRNFTTPGALPHDCEYILLRSRHDAEYRHGSTNIALEVHWRWVRNPTVLPTDTGALLALLPEQKCDGLTTRVPTPETEFVFLCAHGVRHRFARFMWLNDIRWLLSRHPHMDWHRIADLSDHGTAVALHTLALLGCHLPDDAPLEVLPGWRRAGTRRLALRCLKRMGAAAYDAKRNSLEELADEWTLAPSIRSFMRGYFWHRVVLPNDRDITTLHLPRVLHIIYPLIRPWLWLWRQRRVPAPPQASDER